MLGARIQRIALVRESAQAQILIREGDSLKSEKAPCDGGHYLGDVVVRITALAKLSPLRLSDEKRNLGLFRLVGL